MTTLASVRNSCLKVLIILLLPFQGVSQLAELLDRGVVALNQVLPTITKWLLSLVGWKKKQRGMPMYFLTTEINHSIPSL